jgi:hypothetical protein
MDDKVNLAGKLALLDKPFSPGIVGYLNDCTTRPTTSSSCCRGGSRSACATATSS